MRQFITAEMHTVPNANCSFVAVGRFMLLMRTSLPTTILIANLPQLAISYLYITFNNIFTCMLAGQEWMQYCQKRQPLRVTSPVGAQRSTYYLQLPYRYSLPLIVHSALISWLASQSLYMISVIIHDTDDSSKPDHIVSLCGYSPGAIKSVTIAGWSLILITIVLGLRRYPSGMPLASTSSGAISAACHPRADDSQAAVLPIQWGVVSDGGTVGHCSFSSKLVGWPSPGKYYA